MEEKLVSKAELELFETITNEKLYAAGYFGKVYILRYPYTDIVCAKITDNYHEVEILKEIGADHERPSAIIRFIDWFPTMHPSHYFVLVMEYFPRSMTVDNFIERHKLRILHMSPNALEAFLLPLLKQAYEALSFLHERNIGHGDVKNENLLLNSTGTELRLIDFGLSYKISETTDPHLLVVGKEKHDVWSAAVVFAGIIVGKANNPREWDCNGNISSGNEKISCQDYLQLIENRITGDILALFRLLLIDNPAQCISATQVLDSLMNLYGSE